MAKQDKNRAPAVPPMHPRERLTAKAEAAISKYATIQCGDLPIHGLMVRAVLEAERMPRARLYAWLEGVRAIDGMPIQGFGCRKTATKLLEIALLNMPFVSLTHDDIAKAD